MTGHGDLKYVIRLILVTVMHILNISAKAIRNEQSQEICILLIKNFSYEALVYVTRCSLFMNKLIN